ncbi:MAG: class I SAM-dependent methyltransferase [Alphaproteobacteria bacterium]|nr:class I SAM-dependent methyltransferase [Alphaproteobacteria bacterium]MBV9370826.1 class I SAM-dependent methyltransferase [Alphaproteobacteria bacterium]MBV9900094.1 class I SAM-dependent methyltransferase [Alphaproteobacteria bacterium]
MNGISEAITLGAQQDPLRENGVSARTYRMIYLGNAPWEVDRAQPEVVAIAERGGFAGRVLDIGCGTGANTLYLAARGHEVVGIDFVGEAIARADARPRDPAWAISFQERDVFADLDDLGRFDTILDSATLHGFSDSERRLYGERLEQLTHPGSVVHVLGIGDKETRTGGPRRLSRQAILDTFPAERWELVECRDVLYAATIFPGGAKAVAAELRRR